MITVIHYKGGYKHAINSVGRVVLGSGYFTGRQPPNYPVPAIPLIVEYDWYNGKLIGLMISKVYRSINNPGKLRQSLVNYWSKEYGPF